MDFLFYGHSVDALIRNVAWALIGPVILAIFLDYLKTEKTMKKILLGYAFLMCFPNSLYLGLEIRHLIQLDGIADKIDIWSFLVFGGLGIGGYLLTAAQIYICVTRINFLKNHQFLGVVILSFLAALGATLGKVTDLTTLDGIFNPLIVPKLTMEISTLYRWTIIAAITAILVIPTYVATKLIKHT